MITGKRVKIPRGVMDRESIIPRGKDRESIIPIGWRDR